MKFVTFKKKIAINADMILYIVREDSDCHQQRGPVIQVNWRDKSAITIRYDTLAERDNDFFRALRALNRHKQPTKQRN